MEGGGLKCVGRSYEYRREGPWSTKPRFNSVAPSVVLSHKNRSGLNLLWGTIFICKTGSWSIALLQGLDHIVVKNGPFLRIGAWTG